MSNCFNNGKEKECGGKAKAPTIRFLGLDTAPRDLKIFVDRFLGKAREVRVDAHDGIVHESKWNGKWGYVRMRHGGSG
jgi:hypothetical protein